MEIGPKIAVPKYDTVLLGVKGGHMGYPTTTILVKLMIVRSGYSINTFSQFLSAIPHNTSVSEICRIRRKEKIETTIWSS